MANPTTSAFARQTLYVAPWMFFGAVVLGLITCYFGFVPLAYFLKSIGLAVIWFALLVISWRIRSEALRIFSLLFMLIGRPIVLGHHRDELPFEIMQGGCVIFAVISALMLLFRRWIYKYARLDDPVA